MFRFCKIQHSISTTDVKTNFLTNLETVKEKIQDIMIQANLSVFDVFLQNVP